MVLLVLCRSSTSTSTWLLHIATPVVTTEYMRWALFSTLNSLRKDTQVWGSGQKRYTINYDYELDYYWQVLMRTRSLLGGHFQMCNGPYTYTSWVSLGYCSCGHCKQGDRVLWLTHVQSNLLSCQNKVSEDIDHCHWCRFTIHWYITGIT